MKPAKVSAGIVTVIIAVVATCLINFALTSYWVFLCTSAIIAAIALQGVGLVASRAGMISLCQMSFAAVGAWVVAWLNLHGAPGTLLLWVALGGLAAVPLGVAIGLPALRLRGINLAIVTLGFAAAFDVVLLSFTFPGQTKFIFVKRPDLFVSDQAYFALCVAVFVAIALVLNALNRSPLGASWLSIRHSERSTAAHGVSIPQSKLSAFAISAFISGISGGLLAGQLGTLVADSFSLMVSLVYFVVTTMAGAHLVEGAIFGGILIIFFPEVLRRLNLHKTSATCSSPSVRRRPSAWAVACPRICAALWPNDLDANQRNRSRKIRHFAPPFCRRNSTRMRRPRCRSRV